MLFPSYVLSNFGVLTVYIRSRVGAPDSDQDTELDFEGEEFSEVDPDEREDELDSNTTKVDKDTIVV
jgi:hypothetical protein